MKMVNNEESMMKKSTLITIIGLVIILGIFSYVSKADPVDVFITYTEEDGDIKIDLVDDVVIDQFCFIVSEPLESNVRDLSYSEICFAKRNTVFMKACAFIYNENGDLLGRECSDSFELLNVLLDNR